ncbi:hypothetical protein [Algoriphagus kandeliae]|nr:hypothetical protein [Algoriphagus kandeliae]
MIVQGMPWPLVLPVAMLFLIWGIQQGKRELQSISPKKKKKKQKSSK